MVSPGPEHAPLQHASVPLMDAMPGPETVIDGVRYLYFGGTSYLGLQAHPDVIEAGCAAFRRYGVHTGTTRVGFGTNATLVDVEERAAEFFGTESAFYFGSGYVANHIMVSALSGTADAVLLDEGAHFCVAEAAQVAGKPLVRFKHRDAGDLASRCAAFRRVLVMADAVGPSSGHLAPLASYLDVMAEHGGASLLLDDAHGFGVLGPEGRGLYDEFGMWPQVNGGPRAPGGVPVFVCGTLAKALGGFGGIIPGTRAFVDQVQRASHYFDGASPPPPAITAATAKALEIVTGGPGLRQQLRANALRLRSGLRGLDLEVPDGATANLGVTIGDADHMRSVHQRLKERGIVLPYIAAYTGIPSEGVLRFAVFANHSADQIDHLLTELKRLL